MSFNNSGKHITRDVANRKKKKEEDVTFFIDRRSRRDTNEAMVTFGFPTRRKPEDELTGNLRQ